MLLDLAAANPVIEKVKLGIIANNARALHLYRKFGFLEEGRLQRECKKGDGTCLDDVLMARFVV